MHNTSTIPDTNGKGKEKEAHPSPQASDIHPVVEEDTWGLYHLENFPSPPADGFCRVRQPNDDDPPAVPNTDVDPPLTLTYPPLANDPKCYANIFSEVHCHRNHLNKQLELVQGEAVAALAEVTLAQIELSAEMDQMQSFLNRVAFVAGKNFVRKLLRNVQWVMENGENATDRSEEERQSADDEDSNDDDGNGGEERQANAKNDNPSGSGDESEGDEQNSDDDECGADAEEEDTSPDSSPRKVQKNSDNGICIGDDDDKSRRLSQSPYSIPENSSRKRPREEDKDEDKEKSPNNSPRKKFKGENVAESNFASAQHYGGTGGEDEDAASQHVWSPEDDEVDPEPNSDEEYEVEDSLLLVESEPAAPPLAGPSMPRSLLEISRRPHRVRQNSRGEPELYIPYLN